MSHCFTWVQKQGKMTHLKAVTWGEFSFTHRESALLFYGVPLLIELKFRFPAFRTAACFIHFTDSDSHLIDKHPHRNTRNNVWLSVWIPMTLSSWLIKWNSTEDNQVLPNVSWLNLKITFTKASRRICANNCATTYSSHWLKIIIPYWCSFLVFSL